MKQTDETTKKILNFFYQKGILAYRHGVAAGSAEYTTKSGEAHSRYVHGGIGGGSDIFVFHPHPLRAFLGVEVKTGKDRLRENQIGFMQNIRNMGHFAIAVKDYEDFLTQYDILMKENT